MDIIRISTTLILSAYLGSATSKLYPECNQHFGSLILYISSTLIMLSLIVFSQAILSWDKLEGKLRNILDDTSKNNAQLIIPALMLYFLIGHFVIIVISTEFYQQLAILYLPITVITALISTKLYFQYPHERNIL